MMLRAVWKTVRGHIWTRTANVTGPRAQWPIYDARYDTPTEQQGLIGGRVLIDQGIDGARVIAPNDFWRSILFMRANTVEGFKM